MPADFDACVKGGGKIRTIPGSSEKRFGVPGGSYRHVCFDKDGTAHPGEIKKKKTKGGKK